MTGMKPELLEIVDDHNQVIGTADRTEVYLKGWRSRAVHLFLFNPQGQILVQQRSAIKATWPNCFDVSVGETMKPGEEFLEAAYRGLHEELGVVSRFPLSLVHDRYLDDYQYQQYQVKGVVTLFAGVLTEPIKPDPEEVAQAEWWSVDQLTEVITTRADECTPWLVDDWRYTIPRLPQLFKELAIAAT